MYYDPQDPLFVGNNAPYANNSCFCFYRDLLGTPCIIEGFEVLAEYGYQNIDKWAWLGVQLSMMVIYRYVRRIHLTDYFHSKNNPLFLELIPHSYFLNYQPFLIF